MDSCGLLQSDMTIDITISSRYKRLPHCWRYLATGSNIDSCVISKGVPQVIGCKHNVAIHKTWPTTSFDLSVLCRSRPYHHIMPGSRVARLGIIVGFLEIVYSAAMQCFYVNHVPRNERHARKNGEASRDE